MATTQLHTTDIDHHGSGRAKKPMKKKVKFVAIHGSSQDHAAFYGTYMYDGGVGVGEVTAHDLRRPMMQHPGNLFKAVHGRTVDFIEL